MSCCRNDHSENPFSHVHKSCHFYLFELFFLNVRRFFTSVCEISKNSSLKDVIWLLARNSTRKSSSIKAILLSAVCWLARTETIFMNFSNAAK